MTWWGWVVLACCLLALLAVGAFWFRQRTLLATPGSFAARQFVHHEVAGHSRAVVVSYNETSVELFRVFSLSWRPSRVMYRHVLSMDRSYDEESGQSIAILTDAEADQTTVLQMRQENVYELSTWIESGPMVGIGHWREAPRRVQRRRYF